MPTQLNTVGTEVTVVVGNIQGLYTRKNKYKKDMLFEEAKTNNSVIICLTESHLNADISDEEIGMSGYRVFRSDRAAGRKSGGVVVYIRDDHAASAQSLISGSNGFVEWTIIHLLSANTVIACVYRPPNCPTNHFTEFIDSFCTTLEQLDSPMPNIILNGDFNFPGVNWIDETCSCPRIQDKLQAENLLDVADSFMLQQLILEPTRGDNILDLVFTNNMDLLDNIKVAHTTISDHRLITANIALPGGLNGDKRNWHQSGILDAMNFFSPNIEWDEINQKLSQCVWSFSDTNMHPDQIYEEIIEKIEEICVQHIPNKKSNRRRCPLIPRDRKILMRRRARAQKQIGTCIGSDNRQLLETRIGEIEKQLVLSHENENNRKELKAISNISRNSKFFFSYAKQKEKPRSSVGPLKVDSQIVTEPKEMADLLAQQFQSVYSTPRFTETQSNNENLFNETDLQSVFHFTEDEIEKCIGKISNSASAGPDGIPAIFLKKCAPYLKYPLWMLWMSSMEHSSIPYWLKTSNITPIFKGGSKQVPKNYRPVVLTSHLTKTFERILVDRIGKFLEEHNLYNKRQHGFRKNRSCLSQLIQHHQEIIEILENNNSVDVMYLDFAKAFDKVDHGILLRKLTHMGFEHRMIAWIREFLFSREQAVVVEGVKSPYLKAKSGVPQGTVLGPVLFLIYVSDIDSELEHARASSFADDTRLIMEVKVLEDVQKLQDDLYRVYNWTRKNNMDFADKFVHMRYGWLDQTSEYILPSGELIDPSDQTRDLGVIMSSDAKFNKHINEITKKARRRAGWILRVFSTRNAEPMLLLFKTLVRPILEYCSQLWAPTTIGQIRKVENVQRNFTSKIIECRGMTYWERLNFLNLYSLERRRDRYKVIYVWKIISNLAPNVEIANASISTYNHIRRGRLCYVPPLNNRSRAAVRTLKEASFPVEGSKTFNALPTNLRNFEGSLEAFKWKLDRFLSTVPDTPALPHHHISAAGNSLLQQLVQQRAESR